MKPHSFPTITSDNFTIWLGLACAICAFIGYLILGFVRRGDGPEPAIAGFARVCYYACLASIAAACLYLLQSILSGNRFDIAYIYENSSPRDSLLYQISSFWAGQGGSLLLWALMGGLIGVLLLKKLERTSPLLMSFWCSIQCFFLVVMVVDDPVRKLAEFQAGMMGAGLNPLLKNPWMAIHPPVIFLGYALLIVPAAFALQALIDGDASRWARRCLPWALGGWIAMTIGLVLGMVWSYEVLGWGGYWGWDPVENASLVPWLISTALVHGLVLQRVRSRMALWNVVLAFLTFLAVMYATLLTRSGILSAVSVHSFGRTPAFGWLIGFPIAYGVLCTGLLIARWKAVSADAEPLMARSREFALSLGLIVLSLFAMVVLLGTTFTTFNAKSGLDAKFYTHMSIPLAIAMLVLLALSPTMKWGGATSSAKGSSPLRKWGGALAIVAGLALVGGTVSVVSPNTRLFGWLLSEGSAGSRIAAGVMLLLLGSAVVALLSNIKHMAGLSLMRSGAYVSHIGVALLVLGVIFSTAGRSKVIDLTMGGPSTEAFGYRFSYESRKRVSSDAERIGLVARGRGRKLDVPLRVVGSDRGTTFFPYIESNAVRDLYVAPDKIMGDTITPTLSMAENGWVSHPVTIPGTPATLALVGMQVESQLATLSYQRPGLAPVKFDVSEGHPKTIDGYTFIFKGFVSNGAKNMMRVTAGAEIGIRGQGFNETAAVRVAEKPFMSLLWLGALLIPGGGVLAMIRRRREKAA